MIIVIVIELNRCKRKKRSYSLIYDNNEIYFIKNKYTQKYIIKYTYKL